MYTHRSNKYILELVDHNNNINQDLYLRTYVLGILNNKFMSLNYYELVKLFVTCKLYRTPGTQVGSSVPNNIHMGWMTEIA